MFKCDRCGENYTFPPYVIRGMRRNHIVCPLCSFDFKRLADKFVGKREENQGRRICGHKFLYTRHLEH